MEFEPQSLSHEAGRTRVRTEQSLAIRSLRLLTVGKAGRRGNGAVLEMA